MPPIKHANIVLTCAAVFLVTGAAAALAAPPVSSPGLRQAAHSPLIRAESKSPIDESCLMVCTKWNGDTCEKFEQKCKGDPGYPTANSVSPNGGNAGNAGNAGIKGKAGTVIKKAS